MPAGSAARAGVTYYSPTLANIGSVTTETVVASFSIAAGTLTVGMMFELVYFGSSIRNLTFRVRCGTAGTTFDNQVMGDASPSPTSIPFSTAATVGQMQALLRCTATGASGTVAGFGIVTPGPGGSTAANSYGSDPTSASGTVNTTVAQIITLTAQQNVGTSLTSQAASFRRVA